MTSSCVASDQLFVYLIDKRQRADTPMLIMALFPGNLEADIWTYFMQIEMFYIFEMVFLAASTLQMKDIASIITVPADAPANPGAWASAVTMLTKNLVKFSSKFIWLWMIACQFLSTRERRSKWPRSWRFQSAMLERRSLIQQTESSRETCSSLRNTSDAISYIIENVIPLSKPCYLQHHVTVECIINVF